MFQLDVAAILCLWKRDYCFRHHTHCTGIFYHLS